MTTTTDLQTQVLTEVTTLVTAWSTREDEMRDWWSGAINGGPNNDGNFPITDITGVTTLFPGFKKLTSVLMKGDPGPPSATTFGFYVQNGVTSSESFSYIAPSAQVFTYLKAWAKNAATAAATFSITKNGAAAGSIVFNPGVQKAVCTLTGGQLTLAPEDVILITAPASADSTLANLSISFGS